MRKAFAALVLVAVVLCVAGAVAGVMLWNRINEPYAGFSGAEQFINIPAGTGTSEIERRLIEAGLVRDGVTFRAALWWSGRSRGLQAGEFRFDTPLSALGVIDRLARGDVYARRLTFPEGLTMTEMARLYETREFGTADSFIKAAHGGSLVKDLDPEAADLEGYLFPETYALPRGTPAARLIVMMVDRFRAIYTEELRDRAARLELTARQVVTLASLIEKETGLAEERPVVAAVFHNRLRIGMALQTDPTVVYALQRAGRYDGNIRRQDLSMESPYNTYRNPGLPPGPIAAPGKASLEAALMPASVPYLYFVSRNDGSHVFAQTLAEHNRNVRQYQLRR